MIEILILISSVFSLLAIILVAWLFSSANGKLQAAEAEAKARVAEARLLIENLDKSVERVEKSIKDDISRSRDESGRAAKDGRDELTMGLKSFGDSTEMRLEAMRSMIDTNAKANRDDLSASLKNFQDELKRKFNELSTQQAEFVKANELRLDRMRETIEARLKAIQDDSSIKLEKMRETVDEKLHKTLETRLGESFKLVSERLDMVHKGLGEVQNLAVGVGDLKKVLSNVKTRGTLGEYQLENILTQILAPEQYAKNVATKKGSKNVVEFAIKLPGRDDAGVVWIPIDSKFPQDRYQSLLDAYDKGEPLPIEQALRELDAAIKLSAKDIRDKYVDPPHTTDFGIMFLPFEGLYAEVVKRPVLFESLQREYKVTIAGPSTLAAYLNSLSMGFRTLAIEKRSSEVWSILSAVKTEFGRFGEMLDSVNKNLETASKKITEATGKSRTIERKLKDVHIMPVPGVLKFLDDTGIEGEDGNDDKTLKKD